MNTCVQAMFALPWRRVGLVESSQYDHFNGVFASVFNKVHTFFERKLIWDHCVCYSRAINSIWTNVPLAKLFFRTID